MRSITSITTTGILTIATVGATAFAGGGGQEFKLFPNDGSDLDFFGHSVAISGRLSIVGSALDDDNGDLSGSAYLFDTITGQQTFKLLPSDGASEDQFGQSVAIEGTAALVGAWLNDDNGERSGSAYLFETSSGQQIAKLMPNDGAEDDFFGISVAIRGTTVLVGANGDDDNGTDSGSAYLFDTNTTQQIAKLLPTDGKMSDRFGSSVAISGSIAIVGASGADDNGSDSGSAYLFDMITAQQIAKLVPNDGEAFDYFGLRVAISGTAAIVGAYRDDDNGTDSGSAYLFDTRTGQQFAKLLPSDGAAGEFFGVSVAISGSTAVVGAIYDDDNGSFSGSAYLFDTTTGKQLAKLLPNDGTDGDQFGYSAAISGTEAIVSAPTDDDNGYNSGSAYLFDTSPFVDPGPYAVVAEQKISNGTGGFTGVLSDSDSLGQGLATLGDLDGDGFSEVAVGATGDDDGGVDRGAVWILSLNNDGSVRSQSKISSTAGSFGGVLDDLDFFGNELATLGDLDGDGLVELAVGAPLDDDGGTDRGAVWILSLNADGSVFAHSKISSGTGGFSGTLGNFDSFGFGLAKIGDLDGDGTDDLAVSAPLSDQGGVDRGAVWVLFLNPDGTVRANQEISSLSGGFAGVLSDSDFFGRSLAGVGDLDADGFLELAVGAQQDDDGGTDRGAVWILSLAPDGTVRTETKISSTTGGFTGPLDDGASFGVSITWLGDKDGDGIGQLAVGANRLDRGGVDRGGLWLLSLGTDGIVIGEQEISSTAGGLVGVPDDTDRFGTEIVLLPELYMAGTVDIGVGAIFDDDGGTNRGAVYHLVVSPTARAVSRNAGTNPDSLMAIPPVLGGTFTATVDLGGTTGHFLAGLYGYASPITFTLPMGQTLLINIADPSGELLMQLFKPGPLATFDIGVPLDPNLAGFRASVQAVHIGGVFPFALSNAYDLVLGP